MRIHCYSDDISKGGRSTKGVSIDALSSSAMTDHIFLAAGDHTSASSNMSAVLAPNPHRALSTTDIILLISEILRDEKEYATLACFALSSHMHHSAVQPLLAKIKKRIVLDIEDWRWRDRSNDKNIEYVVPLVYHSGYLYYIDP